MNHDHFSKDSEALWRWIERNPADTDDLPVGFPEAHYRDGNMGLANSILTVAKQKKNAASLRRRWRDAGRRLHQTPPALFQLLAKPDLTNAGTGAQLPRGAQFAIQFEFVLRQGLMTKDEAGLYPLDNPVRRDRALQIPYFAASSWKGSISSALYALGLTREADPSAFRLLGNDRDAVEVFASGALHCYPTYFNVAPAFQMIHPLSRRTKTGTPIELEMIPRGTPGIFSALYCAPKPVLPVTEMLRDLGMLGKALGRLLLRDGIGAKTSSGFGGVHDKLKSPGTLLVRGSDEVMVSKSFGSVTELERLTADGELVR